MRWDRLFDDLETQLASEWEEERAALESEAARLRLSRLTLRERLIAIGERAVIAVTDTTRMSLSGAIVAVGADFAALRMQTVEASSLGASDASGAITGGDLVLFRLDAPWQIALPQEDQLRSARQREAPARASLVDRMTLGFVLRDIARKRLPVRVATVGGASLPGTIDRVAADHLDLAVHDAGEARRDVNVRAFSILAFAAIAHVRIAAPTGYDMP